MIKLFVKFESSFIKEFRSENPGVTIGRKADNDLVLDNATVSGHHCKIYKAGETFFIEDLGSTNGTFVNGKKIIKAGLKNNDAITLVKYSLIFSSDASASAPKEAPAAAAPSPAESQSKYAGGVKLRGVIEVLDNPADAKTEYELSPASTYIGKPGKANIPAKNATIFSSVPELAVVITFRPDGYYLIPLKEGFAKYNGDPLKEKVLLKNDDVIEVGATDRKSVV